MAKSAVSVRIDDEKIEELDELAGASKRDRSFLINEAIDLYLDVNSWQVARIKKAVNQAQRGKFSSPSRVSKAIKKWQK